MVEAHAVGDRAHVGADLLAHVGDLVDERDLGGQERVGGVLDHLGRGHAGAHDVGVDAAVEGFDRRAVLVPEAADDDAVRIEEVLDGGALAQELRIGDVGDAGDAHGVEVGHDPLAGAHRHGALHDQEALTSARCDLPHGVLHARKVGVAGGRRWRVHGDEEEVAALEQDVVGRREREPVGVVADELLQTGLVDRDLTPFQPADLLLVEVHAHDVVAQVGETDGRDEADIAGTDDPDGCDIHAQTTSVAGENSSPLRPGVYHPGEDLTPGLSRRRRGYWASDSSS